MHALAPGLAVILSINTLQHLSNCLLILCNPQMANEVQLTVHGTDAMVLDTLPDQSPPALSAGERPASTKRPPKTDAVKKKGVRRVSKSPIEAKASIQESRKRYRERIKQEGIAAKEKFAKVREEIARLKHEQLQLQCENTVLESMFRYSESAVGLLKNAAASISTLVSDSAHKISTAAHSSLMTVYGEIEDAVWCRILRPSDDQLYRLAMEHVKSSFSHRESFIEKLQAVILEWRNANPTGRDLIERKISYAFETRARLAKYVVLENPALMESIFKSGNITTYTTKSAREKAIANRNQLLDHEGLVAATILTEEQRIALRRHWKVYVAHFQKSKGLVDASTVAVEKSLKESLEGELAVKKWATSHLELQTTSASLDELTYQDMVARVKLALGCLQCLRPMQLAYVVIGALPDYDMICDIVSVYKSLLKMEGAADAYGFLKHDYELGGLGGDSNDGASGRTLNGPCTGEALVAGESDVISTELVE